MTVEIPDRLFRRAKIRAVEDGRTMRELVMVALERELSGSIIGEEAPAYFTTRQMDPEFARLARKGAFRGGTDVSEIISDERDAR